VPDGLRGHVKCVPKWRMTLMSAQVRAVPGRSVKSPTTVFPGSNPGPATYLLRSSWVQLIIANEGAGGYCLGCDSR
jgi:hypothetical protein